MQGPAHSSMSEGFGSICAQKLLCTVKVSPDLKCCMHSTVLRIIPGPQVEEQTLSVLTSHLIRIKILRAIFNINIEIYPAMNRNHTVIHL